MPIWLLVTLLQLFIPLNMMLRSCCIDGVEHRKIHWFASLIIIAGCSINMVTLKDVDNEVSLFRAILNLIFCRLQKWPNGASYTGLLILSAVLDVISHTTKEALVRSQPLNQEKFNFRISLI